MDIRVSDYKSRFDVDAAVAALPDKTGVSLVGTEAELLAKQLSATTTVWGVLCKILTNNNTMSEDTNNTGADTTAAEEKQEVEADEVKDGDGTQSTAATE